MKLLFFLNLINLVNQEIIFIKMLENCVGDDTRLNDEVVKRCVR